MSDSDAARTCSIPEIEIRLVHARYMDHNPTDSSASVTSTAFEQASDILQEAATGLNSFVPALLVVDVQNDFVSGSLAVPNGEAVIEPINRLIDLPFKLKIATRDFHPDNHVSFAKTHRKPSFSKGTIYHPEDKQKIFGIMQTLWPIHCVADTNGSEFASGLKTEQFNAVLHKGTHPQIESYSAFRDIWNTKESKLPCMLRDEGVTDVFVVGLAGDYCVKYSALDSLYYGFKTWIVMDAIKSISDDGSAMEEISKNGGNFTESKHVRKLLLRLQPKGKGKCVR